MATFSQSVIDSRPIAPGMDQSSLLTNTITRADSLLCNCGIEFATWKGKPSTEFKKFKMAEVEISASGVEARHEFWVMSQKPGSTELITVDTTHAIRVLDLMISDGQSHANYIAMQEIGSRFPIKENGQMVIVRFLAAHLPQ